MGYSMSNEEYSVEFESIVHDTGLAWLLRFDDRRELWLPKSQCYLDNEDGDNGVLTAPAWLLDEKEINYEV